MTIGNQHPLGHAEIAGLMIRAYENPLVSLNNISAGVGFVKGGGWLISHEVKIVVSLVRVQNYPKITLKQFRL